MADRAAKLGWAAEPVAARRSRHLRLVTRSETLDDSAECDAPEARAAIQPQESTFAALLFRLIPTPRTGRRFAGVYRQIKASIPEAALSRFEGSDGGHGEYQVTMLLLAIRVGASSAAERLFPALRERARRGEDLRGLLLDCTTIAPDLASMTLVGDIIRPIVADRAFPTSAALFLTWLPRIERYTFDTTGAPRCSWLSAAERVRPESVGPRFLP
jgi:hypothetical protein